jgi:hypothetical protein
MCWGICQISMVHNGGDPAIDALDTARQLAPEHVFGLVVEGLKHS